MQNEITTPGKLLDARGRLIQKGYSRRPVLEYNPENIRRFNSQWANRLRLKEWDYYGITTPEGFLSVCVANIGYIGLIFAYWIDFETRTIVDDTIVTPFGRGCTLPLTSEAGNIHFSGTSKRVSISFVKEEEKRVLSVDWPKFAKKHHLKAEITLSQPQSLDSIVMATPIGETLFYYNHKVNCMPAKGQWSLGDQTIDLSDKSSLATLDWGRGVWPYSSFWVWANASGFLSDGRTFGLNMGRGFGDLSAATENCYFIDGVMTKLEGVPIEYDMTDYMKPWRFRDEESRVDLTLTPFYPRKSKLDFLIGKTDVNQIFGMYNGYAVDDSGQKVQIKNLAGWAEDHYARW